MNQTIEKAIIKYIEENEKTWDLYLDGILFSYRTAVHDSTHYTPFEVMYGRKARLPIELDIGRTEINYDPAFDSRDNVLEVMTTVREDVEEAVMKNIQLAQSRQKNQYDKKRSASTTSFPVGSKVLLKNNRNNHRMGGKLDAAWTGPYLVITL